MANAERGEVGLRAGDKYYILKPTTNALCEVETVAGKPFSKIMAGEDGDSFTNVRLFLWGLLRAHHPELTIEQVGDIIDAAGGVVAVAAHIQQAVGVNTPKASTVVKGRATNPRKARTNGTGGNSTSTHAASV